MTQINLGDKVRDKTSGFTGIATSKTEFLNGCIQFGVQGKSFKNHLPDAVAIDQQSLELVNKPKAKKIKKESTGGPNRLAFKPRGY